MSRFMPVTQVRLTNVAIVRLNTHGRRFEVAAYKNKVMNWRNGLETDIDEVLQTTAVFSNVSRGIFAKHQDLEEIFGTTDQEKACRIVLERGELQVSDKERAAALDSMLRDIASIVSEKCVNSESKRPYPVGAILNGLKEIHFAPNLSRSAKTQAIDVIRRLKNVMPIERAKMRIKVTVVTIVLPLVLEKIREEVSELAGPEGDDIALEIGDPVEVDDKSEFTMLIDPSVLRIVNDTLEQIAPSPQSSVDILQLACVTEGQALVDQELARRAVPASTGTSLHNPSAQSAASMNSATSEGSPSVSSETSSVPEGNRKGNRKSKSAKRREKEEARERKQRREAEERRRTEREERLQANKEAAQQESSETTASGSAANSEATTNGTSSRSDDRALRCSCNTCGGEFPDRNSYREHFRSDWHRFNQKRKLAKMRPLSLADFEDLEDPFGADAPVERV